VCLDGDGNRLAPCGRCRQLLYEAGGPSLLVDERPIGELLPDAFGPDALPA
jgi:cytidine deaminase